MIEIKINNNELIDYLQKESEKLIKKHIKNQLLDFSIWDNEEIEEQVNKFFKDLVEEVLQENKEKIKKDVEQSIIDLAKEIALDITAEKLGG